MSTASTSAPRYSVILGNLGNTCDRFLPSGYKDQPTKAEQFRRAGSIRGVTGVELVGSWDITVDAVAETRQHLADAKLQLVSIIPDVFSQKRWGRGSFTSRDPAIRRAAVTAVTEMMDVAAELGCDLINLWPGQDGFDYPFQGDFANIQEWWTTGLQACADHRRDVRIALEYKSKEPRTHSYLATAADTLLVALATGRDNVGVCIDSGHAIMAHENLGASVALLAAHRKLFHIHCNDNYRGWDDDMIVGSVHFAEYAELLYWLRRSGYAGWLSMDQYPYREDGRDAVDASVRFIAGLERKLERFGWERFDAVVASGDSVAMCTLLRELLGISDEAQAEGRGR